MAVEGPRGMRGPSPTPGSPAGLPTVRKSITKTPSCENEQVRQRVAGSVSILLKGLFTFRHSPWSLTAQGGARHTQGERHVA